MPATGAPCRACLLFTPDGRTHSAAFGSKEEVGDDYETIVLAMAGHHEQWRQVKALAQCLLREIQAFSARVLLAS